MAATSFNSVAAAMDVVGIGAAVTDWTVGDAVVAFLPMEAGCAAADYVLAPAEVPAAAWVRTALAARRPR